MKKLFIYSMLLVAFVTVSCKTESLQSYLVESQEKEGFITFDVPASVLQLSMDKASEQDKEAYESIKKINITGVPYKNLDEASYEAEKEKLKAIFKKSSYKELMKFKKDGANAAIYYTGDADAIDEIVAFGYGKEMGVGVARILGENMNVGKIMEMMQKAKMDAGNLDLKQFKMIFDDKHRSSEETE
ncbi:DUF4252 domain-containing protein [Tenacibaculum mesophilum]|uniref:DUF4252 domain-containing protein n=1 Tax=Tenacibaculum mesophilum TaxID=104268 RepID=UPI00374A45B6